MKIGIDARLLERKMTGIGRFLDLFLKELPEVDKENKYILFTYEEINYQNNFYLNVPTIRSFLPQKIFSPIWMNLILPTYLRRNKIDIFFSVNQLIPINRVSKIRYILVLHDVIYKVNKKFHPFIYRIYLSFFTYFSIKYSDLIITVSKYSKSDILKYYDVKEDK